MLSHCTCLLIGWGVPLLIMAVWTGARIIKRTPSVHNTAQSASEDYYFQTGPLLLVEDRRDCALIGWIIAKETSKISEVMSDFEWTSLLFICSWKIVLLPFLTKNLHQSYDGNCN